MFGCSNLNNEVDGHWHCLKPQECEFATIDIKDSTIVFNKYIIGLNASTEYYSQDLRVRRYGDKLSFGYGDAIFDYCKSDLTQCRLFDRYMNSLIDLSLPEVDVAKPFEISIADYNNVDFIIGKLKAEGNELNSQLARQYPDSIFIQVDDVLIGYQDIPLFMRRCKDCLDCGKENVNLHVDIEVPKGVVDKVTALINSPGSFPTILHYVVKTKNGDIGLVRIHRYGSNPNSKSHPAIERTSERLPVVRSILQGQAGRSIR